MKKLIVGQSGGPTSVINGSLAGVYYEAKKKGFDKVYGMVNGIEGFLKEQIVDLDDYFLDKHNLELLKRTPSSFLGTCRFKLGSLEENEETYEKVFKILDKHDIDSLIYIGGNDSMDTVESLSDYAKLKKKKQNFIGVPKTIDNDLPITDHCPGFGSACKYIATTLREIIQDNNCYGNTKPTIAIVEIMGRHAGWLTASSALAKDETGDGVDAIYLPEIPFNMDDFVRETQELLKKKSSIVIAVSEGIKTEEGQFVCELADTNLLLDSFGHKQLAGCADVLSKVLKEKLNIKTRTIILSTLQRSAVHLASKTDLEEAYRQYQIKKASNFLRLFNEQYRNSKTEHLDGIHERDTATQMHHIFPQADYPEIAALIENLIALTPTQHLSYAHPENNTHEIDEQYQHLLLLSKSARIEENLLGKVGDVAIYNFDDFITVLQIGFNDNSVCEIENMNFKQVNNAINFHYNSIR